MSNFVVLNRRQFEEILPDGYRVVDLPGTKEFVYDVDTSNPDVAVRIYSTVDTRTGKTRDIGMDAIRIVFWDKINEKPVGKGKKILRVEKITTIGERIRRRMEEFLSSANNVEILDYDYVRAILSHDSLDWNNFAQSLLEGLEEYGSLTDKQLAYVIGRVMSDGSRSNKNPKSKDSLETWVIKRDSNFREDYRAQRNAEPVEIDYEQEAEDMSFNDLPPELQQTVEPEPEQIHLTGRGTLSIVHPNGSEEVVIGDGSITVTDGHRVTPTAEYPAHQYPFEFFNPVQSEVLPHMNEDKNLVIGANTSAGKTICAEFFIDSTLLRGERVIYLSPLKSLTQEKYGDWKKRYPNEEITILTGDYTLSEKMKKKLAKSSIIVMTSEMCDSRTRRMKSEKNFWLKQVGLVIVDESHILSTNRGHAVEAGLMRFTKINRKARVLLLSATMPNVNELASWLTVLNGKESIVVSSTWRPVELQKKIIEYPVYRTSYGYEDYWRTQNEKIGMAVGIVMSKPDEKFLVFCHDKNTGRRVIKKLKDAGVETHFHNADLDLEERMEIESSFQNRDNGIRVLVSTSTLAWGRNLPARNVVIVGVHRGINEIDELDVIQMAGRAGRYGIDDAGFVYLLVPPMETSRWLNVFENPRPVESVLFDQGTLAFHLLAEIETKEVKNNQDIFNWYARSLSYLQNLRPFTEADSLSLEQVLKDMEMINSTGDRITITGLGRVSSWLYYSPYDIWKWFNNFDKYFNNGEQDDEALSWAIGDIPNYDLGYIPRDLENKAYEWSHKLRSKGFQVSSAVLAAMACYQAITDAEVEHGTINNIRREIVYDISRMSQAFQLIDKMYARWNKDIWQALPYRIRYGIGEELVQLVRIPGVGGKRAKKLWEKGITTVEQVATSRKLTKIFTPTIAKKIRLGAKQLLAD